MARRKALSYMFGVDTVIKDLLPFKEVVVGNLENIFVENS
jgi:hypothetical protein